jgi:hypothetical protein
MEAVLPLGMAVSGMLTFLSKLFRELFASY